MRPRARSPARTALITGAGNGLGRAIALGLAARGARPVRVGRSRAKLELVAGEIGPTARGEVCDIADDTSVATLAERLVDEQISILVNNAGVAGPVASLMDISVPDWDDRSHRAKQAVGT